VKGGDAYCFMHVNHVTLAVPVATNAARCTLRYSLYRVLSRDFGAAKLPAKSCALDPWPRTDESSSPDGRFGELVACP
jgi:hypothetical protein